MKKFNEYLNEMSVGWEYKFDKSHSKDKVGRYKNLRAIFDPKEKSLYIKDYDNMHGSSLALDLTPEQVIKIGKWTTSLHPFAPVSSYTTSPPKGFKQ